MYSQLSTISPVTQISNFVYLSSGHYIYVSKEEGQWLLFEAKMVRHKKNSRNTVQTLTGRGRRVETVLNLQALALWYAYIITKRTIKRAV
jgi:hypothetical protein